jgi:hypothetical protein
MMDRDDVVGGRRRPIGQHLRHRCRGRVSRSKPRPRCGATSTGAELAKVTNSSLDSNCLGKYYCTKVAN